MPSRLQLDTKAVLFLLTAVGAVWSVPAQAGAIYKCVAEDVRRLGDDGKLDNLKQYQAAKELFGSLIVDTDTGLFQDPMGAAHWKILNKGGDNYDFVATPEPSTESASTDFIRIRAWKGTSAVTFFRLNLTTVATGRCEVIR